ncbi:MAG: hypothetical protein ACLFR1_12635 [Spirochaetia bacterium]
MAKENKIYDYNMDKVKGQLVTVLKKRKNESTVADLIAETGLPKHQVEEVIKIVSNEYNGHMKVTESGDILYYFPNGMKNTVRGLGPGLQRFFKKAVSITGKVLAFLFKIWIMIMLVGYFILFVALLVLAVVASIAGTASSRGSSSRSRGRGSFGLFYLTARVFEFFIHLWLYSGMKKKHTPKARPLHKGVFAFVFGEEDPNKTWEELQKKMVIAFIRAHKGVITTEELVNLTGISYNRAESLINRYLLEFEGNPIVTDEGTLAFEFPALMRSREQVSAGEVPHYKKGVIPFNTNKKSLNRWIAFFNGFNLLFGGYFFYFSILSGGMTGKANPFSFLYVFTNTFFWEIGLPASIVPIGLGIVPVVFAVLFYAVPLVRRMRDKTRNLEIKQDNFRSTIMGEVLLEPESVRPSEIKPKNDDEKPDNWEKFRESFLKSIGTQKGIEFNQKESGVLEYQYPELAREVKDIKNYRSSIDTSKYQLGEEVFDSGE